MFFKGFVETKNKKCIEKFKGRTDFKTFEQVQSLPEYAGILAADTILVDIDDSETSEILFKVVQEYALTCRVYRTSRGKHFLFKNSGVPTNKTGCKLAIGLTADIKIGTRNSYEVLKYGGKEREILYDTTENEEAQPLPRWLHPVKSNMEFLNMDAGDGRNQSLFNYILTLQSNDFSVEEARETIRIINKFARVDKDSYVWDFATGSAGLLVAAMNEMIDDAKEKISSPEEYQKKVAKIKATQLLGLEILPQIYMLAILNMILMGDGSSNILNQDSLKNFDGNYGFISTEEKFPATAFVLNPPYSADGNGMIFVEKALSMMENGYAAIIIQNSAGSGKAVKYNKEILKHSTLLASIKMPIDLFVGKSSVQTNIYVFKVGEPHHAKNTVKFIDFSNDGYTRTNRKKASVNLRDTDHAKERYQEIADIVRFGKSELNIFTEKEYYEGKINPENGADWNQSAPIDTIPTLEDFKKTVSDYLAWEVSTLLKGKSSEDNERLGK